MRISNAEGEFILIFDRRGHLLEPSWKNINFKQLIRIGSLMHVWCHWRAETCSNQYQGKPFFVVFVDFRIHQNRLKLV